VSNYQQQIGQAFAQPQNQNEVQMGFQQQSRDHSFFSNQNGNNEDFR
jgi:hypothetical protein